VIERKFDNENIAKCEETCEGVEEADEGEKVVEGTLKACNIGELEESGVDKLEATEEMLRVGSAITVPAVNSFARKESK
jgi:hypothetical protein